jgi:hypothetical protein
MQDPTAQSPKAFASASKAVRSAFYDSRVCVQALCSGPELLAAQSNSRGTVVIVSENTSGADYPTG